MKYILIILTCFIFQNRGFAQVKNLKNDSPYPTKYISQDDAHLTLKTLTVAPAYDNVGGIYQAVAEKTLAELISEDQFWAYEKFQWPESVKKADLRIDTIDEKPQIVLDILKLTKANGLLTLITTKSPQGISVNLSLYTEDKGLPLIQVSYQDPTTFEISKFKEILKNLYNQLKLKLPYKAFVTSRRGNKITINAGANLNLKNNDKLSVAQIIKINRHPKLKFMTGIEKVIIGQIVLNKVEDYSSFGEIVFEIESGVIETNSKLLLVSEEPKAAEQPAEWTPAVAPQFGKITLLGGISDYKLSTILANGSAYNSGNSFCPTFLLAGELWITPDYFTSISLHQQFFSGTNSLTGSFPQMLNYTVNTTDFLFGYKHALNGNFWGPSLLASAGYIAKSTTVSDSSPTAFSSFETTGLQFQVGGYFPVNVANDVGLGVDAKFLLTTRLSESPVNSGSSSPTLNEFSFYGNYMHTANINLKAQIIFSSINSGFDGAGNRINPARSIEEKATSYLFGAEYLF